MKQLIVKFEWEEDLGSNWVDVHIIDCLIHTQTHLNRGNVKIKDITERYRIDKRKSEVLSELISSHNL